MILHQGDWIHKTDITSSLPYSLLDYMRPLGDKHFIAQGNSIQTIWWRRCSMS
uniref:Uncharacterized protein n=1 Tax=Arundo donax TaxID=35708 RepID=A0A0A9EQH3_ARUDO